MTAYYTALASSKLKANGDVDTDLANLILGRRSNKTLKGGHFLYGVLPIALREQYEGWKRFKEVPDDEKPVTGEGPETEAEDEDGEEDEADEQGEGRKEDVVDKDTEWETDEEADAKDTGADEMNGFDETTRTREEKRAGVEEAAGDD